MIYTYDRFAVEGFSLVVSLKGGVVVKALRYKPAGPGFDS